jgi:hypothetical protein
MDFWWGVIAAVLAQFAIGFMVAFLKMIMELGARKNYSHAHSIGYGDGYEQGRVDASMDVGWAILSDPNCDMVQIALGPIEFGPIDG